jgi:hypothetical protein
VLGATSWGLWVTALAIDLLLHQGSGVLPFSVALLAGFASVVALGLSAVPDRARQSARRVGIDGTTVRGALASDVTRLDGAVAGCPLGPSSVALRMKDGTLHELELDEPNGAEPLLDRLGLSLDRRALRMPLATGSRWGSAALALGLGGLVFAFSAVALAGAQDLMLGISFVKCITMMLFVGAFLGSAIGLKRSLDRLDNGEVVVGLDGIVIRDKGLARFVPMAELVQADAVGSKVVVRRQPPSGGAHEIIEIPVACAGDGDTSRADAVVDALRRAIERRPSQPSTAGEALDRGPKSLRAWRAQLAGVSRADASYRSVALGTEELGALVLDASAPPDRRVGAALALASTAPTEARDLVRIAIPAVADDDLRASLEAAAEGEIDSTSLSRSMRLHGRSR